MILKINFRTIAVFSFSLHLYTFFRPLFLSPVVRGRGKEEKLENYQEIFAEQIGGGWVGAWVLANRGGTDPRDFCVFFLFTHAPGSAAINAPDVYQIGLYYNNYTQPSR